MFRGPQHLAPSTLQLHLAPISKEIAADLGSRILTSRGGQVGGKVKSSRVVVACINWNHPSPVPHAMAYVLRDGSMIADWYFPTWAEAMDYAVPLARRLAGVAS